MLNGYGTSGIPLDITTIKKNHISTMVSHLRSFYNFFLLQFSTKRKKLICKVDINLLFLPVQEVR